MWAPVGGTTAGLPVSSPSSCASHSAARAAANRPRGASTKSARKASPAARRASAPVSRARWIQRPVSSSRAASSMRSAAAMAANSTRCRARSGSTPSLRKACTARRSAGTAAAYPSATRAVQPWSRRFAGESGGSPAGGRSRATRAMPSRAGAVAAQPANTEASSAESSASLAARGASVCSRRAAVSKVGGRVGHLATGELDPALSVGWPAPERADPTARGSPERAARPPGRPLRRGTGPPPPTDGVRRGRPGSPVSSAARSRSAAAAAYPPRLLARSAAASCSAAASSSGPAAAAARCHALMSSSPSSSLTAARVWCACRRWRVVAVA